MPAAGSVYLVGAGPGAVDLLTVRAARLLARADVVIYDRLSNEELLALAPAQAEKIYAGKRGGGGRAMEQEEINRLLVEKAQAGLTVVRLKGGDPFIFGRGGEEGLALAHAGIHFEVVPGISSAIAVPAFAGIPLTHRDYGSFVAIVTGHQDRTKQPEAAVPWADLARAAGQRGTLVLLMAHARLHAITAELLAAGLPAETPAAAISHGTGAAQRSLVTSLAQLAREVERAQLASPAIFVIGAVAGLRAQLQWFEQRPLFGRRIVVTRARAEAGPLADRLREAGAEVFEVPTIAAQPPEDYTLLDRALADLAGYDWIVFTSANGVRWFMRRLRELKLDVRALGHARLAAIGPATARALGDCGLLADAVPAEYRAEAIIPAIGLQRISGARFLIPRAQMAREVLLEMLRAAGAAEVNAVAAYRTVMPQSPGLDRLRGRLAEGGIDLVTFTSSSTVSNFSALIGPLSPGQAAATIGPITEQTARQYGFNVVASAREYTVDGLFSAVCEYLRAQPIQT
ncbi:MAG TPA: uroporphyrinogen-III C-methyltransferase [Candidatus Binataceae bacterium]|nr:uroporphyrinogen-III C-methyltransferase [Candidatus Binataceae bacterium]